MSADTPSGTFVTKFFGFDLEVTVRRQSFLSANYADVEFYFPEGYKPNGSKILSLQKTIEKLFDVETVIEDDKKIKFKYVSPHPIGLNKDMLVGMAIIFFKMTINKASLK